MVVLLLPFLLCILPTTLATTCALPCFSSLLLTLRFPIWQLPSLDCAPFTTCLHPLSVLLAEDMMEDPLLVMFKCLLLSLVTTCF